MKLIDVILQNWRIKKAIKFIKYNSNVLDIGAFDSSLFDKLGKNLNFGIGIDPLISPIKNNKFELIKGHFPIDLKNNNVKFDAVVMLAVLEHIPENIINDFSASISSQTISGGRLIITVPDVKVDLILNFLLNLKLIDGMSLDEHHGFDVNKTVEIFECYEFKLIHRSKFQLGLNNLFVFEKK